MKRFYNKPTPRKTFTKLELRKMQSKVCSFLRVETRRAFPHAKLVVNHDPHWNVVEKDNKPLRIDLDYSKIYRNFGL
jgi:hypothetical protein